MTDRANPEDVRECLVASAEKGRPVIRQRGPLVIGADAGPGNDKAVWALIRRGSDGRLTLIDSGVGDFPRGSE